MAPNITTEAVIEKLNDDYGERKDDPQQKTIPRGIPVYDQMVPKNESRFMTVLRNWERRCGFVTPIRWFNSVAIILYHVIAVVWFLHTLLYRRNLFQWQCTTFATLWGLIAGFGITGGAHRLWSHRSFKAKWPLKIILAICFSAAGQNNIYEWVRDHRVHHKCSETSADPHNANRGFFFSHVGWLMMKKHPDVLREGVKIDMTDITGDPIIQFHIRHFTILKLLFCFVIPTMIPVCCWGGSWQMSVMAQCFVRYVISLNATWSVNSFAHLWGNKPYDRNIMPSENWGVSFMALGEGWHNYHHTFPWDYKAAELPYTTNLTTILLDCFAAIGWAYDMKEASQSLIKAVVINRGDVKQHSLIRK